MPKSHNAGPFIGLTVLFKNSSRILPKTKDPIIIIEINQDLKVINQDLACYEKDEEVFFSPTSLKRYKITDNIYWTNLLNSQIELVHTE